MYGYLYSKNYTNKSIYMYMKNLFIIYLLRGFDASTSNFDKSFRNYGFCYIFKFFTYKTNPFITLSIYMYKYWCLSKIKGEAEIQCVLISKFSPYVHCFRQVILAISLDQFVSKSNRANIMATAATFKFH